VNKSNTVASTGAALTVLSLAILAIRLITLPFPDLVDTTEGRYAGVAQIMLERDDWVTPWIHIEGSDKPYLGKPPLHFWLVQASFLVFGYNNFAARLPSLISGLGITAAIWWCCSTLLSQSAGLVAVSVLASSCIFFFLSGAVVLDTTLTLGVTLALVGLLLSTRSRLAKYLAFAGTGLGVLVKGPLACVLVVGIALPWAVTYRILNKKWPKEVTGLPWLSGLALLLAITLPWYIWAEIRNPGFLKYFLWNENFGRYLKSDYGDAYGTGHRQPFGTAWLMMVPALCPWSVLLPAMVVAFGRRALTKGALLTSISDPMIWFGLCWTFSCPVLLLGAEQYTATYIMPSMPGFALLSAALWEKSAKANWLSEGTIGKILNGGTVLMAFTFLVGSVISFWYGAHPLFSVAATLMSATTLWLTINSALKRPPLTSGSTQARGALLVSILNLALLTCFTYGAAVLCFNNHLSNNRSSKRILELVKRDFVKDSPLLVAFPYYFPFSARFYTTGVTEGNLTIKRLMPEEVATGQADLLIVRKRNLARLLGDRPNLSEVASLGQWRVMKPSAPAE
jgi:4-amino-4-deoxy-L-arabinose transferase-like glycosyltransferase